MTVSLKSSRYRRRVTIQKPTYARDSTGGGVPAWADLYANVPAAIQPLNGAEQLAGAQVQAKGSVKVALRYLPGVDESMRVLHSLGGSPETFEIFKIESVLADATGQRELQLVCSKRLNEGFRRGDV